MAIRTAICDLLGIEHPVILGGMLGVSNGPLAAAVSEAGGLGTISTATFGPDGTRAEIEKIQSLTDKPFSVNVPVFHPAAAEMISLLPECGVKIVTTAAGDPGKFTATLKEMGITVLHVVPSLRAAMKASASGVDALVVEGIESGGKVSRDEIPVISLIPQVADRVEIPVVGAGGLADGRGLLAVLALGAQAAQLGTRFIATEEAPVHPNWKRVLIEAGDAATGVACRISSPTRMIRNQFFAELDAADSPGKGPLDFLPLQGAGMSRIPDDPDGSLGNYVAGTGAGLIHEILPAGEVVRELVRDAERDLARLQRVFTN